ncbi:hypothetical protein D3C72_1800040 [compost metagenome]
MAMAAAPRRWKAPYISPYMSDVCTSPTTSTQATVCVIGTPSGCCQPCSTMAASAGACHSASSDPPASICTMAICAGAVFFTCRVVITVTV